MGVPVHLLPHVADYADWLVAWAQAGRGAHVITLNAEMTMQANQAPALFQLLSQAELVVPDGAGVVLNLKLLQGKSVSRCPGIELADTLLRRSPDIGSVFFYGGKPDVIAQAVENWQRSQPELDLVGYQDGYISPADEPALCDRLQALQPKLILVGLGVPRQEFWIAQHRHLCPNAIWIGVGGSFDIWSGLKTRAPGWLRNNNLEWVYRLYQEPWRWRRMLALPHFAWRSLLYQLNSKR